MVHVAYHCLRGKVRAFAPAEPPTNPHLWVIVEAGGAQWFATVNVRSDKDAPGEPIGKSYLYYFIDHDFAHPIVPSVLARPQGLTPVSAPMPAARSIFSAAISSIPTPCASCRPRARATTGSCMA